MANKFAYLQLCIDLEDQMVNFFEFVYKIVPDTFHLPCVLFTNGSHLNFFIKYYNPHLVYFPNLTNSTSYILMAIFFSNNLFVVKRR